MRRSFLRAGGLLRASSPGLIRVGAHRQRRMAGSLPGVTMNMVGAGVVGVIGLFVGYKALFCNGYAREKELKQAILDILDNLDYDDGSLGPVLIRLAWHASGTFCNSTMTGGSTGATMRFEPECSDGANAGLDKAREFLEPIKAEFPDVSYGDLWVFAGLVALEEMGGPHINMRWGRNDLTMNSEKIPPNGRLPDAAQGAQHIRDVFYRMGFNDQEIVALVGGGHALGRCHSDRSGFEGPWTNSPTTFSNEFFRVLFEEKWTEKRWRGPKQFEDSSKKLMMLPADLALRDDPAFRKWSEVYYKDSDQLSKDFASAFKKLLELGFNDKKSCSGLTC